MVEKGKHGIVAFAFGVPYSILSNQLIANIASQKAQELEAPVYTQRDVHVKPEVRVWYVDETPGRPPPSLRIARGVVIWAKHMGISILWVVAAKPHLWRCIRDLNYAVREVKASIDVNVCQEIEKYPEDKWFCLTSTQERTRSRQAWEKRERILKLMPMFLYKLVAG